VTSRRVQIDELEGPEAEASPFSGEVDWANVRKPVRIVLAAVQLLACAGTKADRWDDSHAVGLAIMFSDVGVRPKLPRLHPRSRAESWEGTVTGVGQRRSTAGRWWSSHHERPRRLIAIRLLCE
jgi:hypothetical protein